MKLDRLLKEIKRDELIQLTQDIIRIPSVRRQDGGGSEEEVALFLSHLLEEMGLDVVVEEVEPGAPNVIGVLQGQEEGPCLMFECHTDVVTEGDASEWKYGPFEGRLSGNRIYGRGACDTKGNLAAAVQAVKAISQSGTPFRGKILLGILVDEEGMMSGVKHFIRQGWAKSVDAAIICEPVDNHLCITQKGALRAELITTGKMSHGAMPLSGLNPIPPMISILERMRQLEDEEIERLGKHPFLGYPSITPTVLQAPVKGEPQLNVLPHQCRALLDIRTIPGQLHEILKKQLEDIVREEERLVQESLHSGPLKEIRESLEKGLSKGILFEAKLDIFEDRPWTKTAENEPIVQAVSKAYQMVIGEEPIYDGVPGATDGTFLSAWAEVPIVTIGAGKRMIPHQKDEWVSVEDLCLIAKIYALSAIEFLKGVD
ncbi:MAG: acetylornithine deacetylase or succinyl-diaminopimelate desuccinylase [Deltaproteobacteria bacterium]|nr:acetylornithine deacetylase or succinyl-diaminopimelate desuccinylase [Deltaproteobacteria bacterium]